MNFPPRVAGYDGAEQSRFIQAAAPKGRPMRVLTLFMLTACCAVSGAEEKPARVFILAGQSNMVGKGEFEKLTPAQQATPANVRFMKRAGKLGPLKAANGSFGPEFALAHALSAALPGEQIVLVKLASGGTSALAWSPEWTAKGAAVTDNQRQGPLYRRLMQMVKPLLARKDMQPAAVIWAQGGRDARFAAAARDYAANLSKIIAAFRRDTGAPALPFIFAQTVAAPANRFPHIEKVRTAQAAIAQNDKNAHMISCTGLATHRDNVHFNTAGQLELGKRFSKAYLKVAESK